MQTHRLRFTLGAVALAALGCTAHPPQPAAPAPAPVSTPASRLVKLELRDSALVDALQAVAAAAGKPVVIAPDAQPIARCARITLLAPEPLPVDQLEPLLAEAVSAASLTLASTENGWVLRRGEGPEPSDCEASKTPEPTAKAEEYPDRGKMLADVEDVTRGIRRVGDHHYEVERGSFDGMLENQAGLMREARIVPASRDGQVRGIRLFGVRSPSVLGSLGFQNGDTILRVAGLPIDSPDKALEAYAKVRNADQIEVDVERRGRTITMTYRLIDP